MTARSPETTGPPRLRIHPIPEPVEALTVTDVESGG